MSENSHVSEAIDIIINPRSRVSAIAKFIYIIMQLYICSYSLQANSFTDHSKIPSLYNMGHPCRLTCMHACIAV